MSWQLLVFSGSTLTTDIPTHLFVCDEKSKQIGTSREKSADWRNKMSEFNQGALFGKVA